MGVGYHAMDALEDPVHEVTLSAYEIDRTEVTVEAFAECVAARACPPPTEHAQGTWKKPGQEKHPVNFVDWDQARAFCDWRGARLPTEAEWEFAARGTESLRYPWGNAAPRREDAICWMRLKVGTCQVGTNTKDRSPFGVLDMAGNVSEWVHDYMHPYSGTAQRDPRMDESGEVRVKRGRNYMDGFDPDVLLVMQSGARDGNWPDQRSRYTGFRCARSPTRGP